MDKIDSFQLGKRIKEIRKKRLIRAEVLAEKCNITNTYMRQIESGVKTPSIHLLVQLANELHCTIDSLLIEESPFEIEIKTNEIMERIKKLPRQRVKELEAVVYTMLNYME